ATSPLPLGELHAVDAVFDVVAGTAVLYVDGEVAGAGSFTAAASFPDNTESLSTIGIDEDETNGGIDGDIDEVRFAHGSQRRLHQGRRRGAQRHARRHGLGRDFRLATNVEVVDATEEHASTVVGQPRARARDDVDDVVAELVAVEALHEEAAQLVRVRVRK